MKKITFIVFMAASAALIGCGDEKAKAEQAASAASAAPDSVLAAPIATASPADVEAYKAKCAMCHEQAAIAPTVAEIKALPAYQGNPEAVAAWAKAPSATPKRAGKAPMAPVPGTQEELLSAARGFLAAK